MKIEEQRYGYMLIYKSFRVKLEENHVNIS